MSVDTLYSRLAHTTQIARISYALALITLITLVTFSHTAVAHADDYGSSTSTQLFGSPGPVTWEVRTAPIAYLAKWYTVDIAYVFGEQFAMGPAAIFYNGDDLGNMITPTYNGAAYGLSAAYYFKPVHKNGTYISSHIYYDKYDNYPHGAPKGDYDKVEGIKANLVYGYRTHLSVFSISMGLGAEYRDYDVSVGQKTYPGDAVDRGDYGNRSGVIPYVEFKIGIEI